MFLRVNLVTSVGCALKSKKLTLRFLGPYEIIKRIGAMVYRIVLQPLLSNLHSVIHVPQLQKYVYDLSHVIQVDDLEVRDNMTIETVSLMIEDRKVKRLRGKENVLVKVIWVGPTRESITWELKSRMKESYPKLFPSGNFEEL